MELDLDTLRSDFPPLKAGNGKPPIYFDNSCMTLRPNSVIDVMSKYYREHPSCHLRAVHDFGLETTKRYHEARVAVSEALGATRPEEIVFTRNTTEGINLVAHGLNLREGDVVLTSDFEHNSNLLPWQVLSHRSGVIHRLFDIEPGDGAERVFEKYKAALQKQKVKLVSVFHTSHVTGQSLPIREMALAAHEQGALFMCDAAQALLHHKLDVRELDVDFLAVSFHKALGPSGMGALFGKHEHLTRMSPMLVGGETVEDVDYDSCVLAPVPQRFEAGLQNYSGAMGAAEALKAVERCRSLGGFESERDVFHMLREELRKVERIKILGAEGSVLNFWIDRVNSGELSRVLNATSRIMVRSGVMCCHAWYKKHSIPTTLRVSLAPYNVMREATELMRVLRDIWSYF